MSNLVSTSIAADPDIIAQLLADKRSINTKRAYQKDLKDFFNHTFEQPPSQELIAEFLQLERFTAIAIVLKYKSQLITRGLKEATVNRRLSAIKSLVNFANKIGHCEWNLNQVQGEQVQAYRDTTGVNLQAIKAMLGIPNQETINGKRDYAILRLLWDNALRRSEVVRTNVSDFDIHSRSLLILGKGRGTQKTSISLSHPTIAAIQAWLDTRKDPPAHYPLFISLAPGSYGQRLNNNFIYKLVDHVAKEVGIPKQMSPHRIRHSAITAALDATNGNVRKVQKLSRHKKIDTLMKYDDNRLDVQGEITDLLSNIL
ncbi:integrase family protein [Thalassoporum mexicanum PCC 7367]|uniref:tyrosine-type recombinase/integrase n=1 Tax=Thalassoporum mexicanum TaxID=3457544 RepID=UPI00029FACB1|nr:tyrosine-type recombinase/integrase [Pseudanabaena sp. PCC 7367]AFY71498.1 integrase family protein [Pseudanabaena sp. PCC 7367]